jgi:hypothetical protein
MKQNVLTFASDGSIHHTLKDSFFDTRVFGKRSIKRMTHIDFCSKRQKFYITWKPGGWSMKAPTIDKYAIATKVWDDKLFDTYEDAVSYEIETVNNLRKAGFLIVSE